MARTKSVQGATPEIPLGEIVQEEEKLIYIESEYQTQFLKDYGLPVCPKCGTGYHGDGEGKYFCPNHLKTCPMVDENGNPK